MKKLGSKTIIAILVACVILGGVVGALITSNLRDREATPNVKVYEILPTQPRAEEDETKLPKLLRLRDEETAESVNVVTTYCTFSYPIGFTDVIEALVVYHDDRSAVDFSARVNGGHYPLYSIDFCGEGDILLGTLKVDSMQLPVCATKHAESAELPELELEIFRDAQKTLDDIFNALCKDEAFTPSKQMAELHLLESTETEEAVIYKTSLCTVSYPYMFTDLVELVVVSDGTRNALEFYARVNGGHYPIYTIDFSGEGDILLGSLSVGGKTYEVRGRLYDETADLSGDDLLSFQAGRETFNDVWQSLFLNEGFTPAQ